MARLRSSGTAVPDLRPDVIAILLAGWGAEPPVPGPFRGFGGGFMRLASEHEGGAAATGSPPDRRPRRNGGVRQGEH